MRIIKDDIISINKIDGSLTLNHFFNNNDTDIDNDGNSEGSITDQMDSFKNKSRFLVVMNKNEIDLFRESVYNLSKDGSNPDSTRNKTIKKMKENINEGWDYTRS